MPSFALSCMYSRQEIGFCPVTMKTSNVKSRGRHGFAAAGWAALHQAVIDRSSELETRGFVEAEQYPALIGRVLELADIDINLYGYQSTPISRAVWRWITTTARRDATEQWRYVADAGSWTALLVAFNDWTGSKKISVAGPAYTVRDLRSVVKFGYWLFHDGELSGQPQISAILWGLALIGAAWGMQRRCGLCRLCFRHARPGEMHCDFHSQSSAIDLPRSVMYRHYRKGRLARELALKDTHAALLIIASPIQRHIYERLVLSDVLFQFDPDDDESSAHSMLIYALEISPRVVSVSEIDEFHTMPYKTLIECLRNKIDPHNWSNDLWEVRVLQAERWLEFEEQASPGVRGKGRKTSAMVSRAIGLASSGHSKGQIAAVLGVTPSAISQWIRRYPAFRQVCTNDLD